MVGYSTKGRSVQISRLIALRKRLGVPRSGRFRCCASNPSTKFLEGTIWLVYHKICLIFCLLGHAKLDFCTLYIIIFLRSMICLLLYLLGSFKTAENSGQTFALDMRNLYVGLLLCHYQVCHQVVSLGLVLRMVGFASLFTALFSRGKFIGAFPNHFRTNSEPPCGWFCSLQTNKNTMQLDRIK